MPQILFNFDLAHVIQVKLEKIEILMLEYFFILSREHRLILFKKTYSPRISSVKFYSKKQDLVVIIRGISHFYKSRPVHVISTKRYFRVKNTNRSIFVPRRPGLSAAALTNTRSLLRPPSRPPRSACTNSANLPSRPKFCFYFLINNRAENNQLLAFLKR